jgi:CheY-like chemotaxis protein
VTSVLHDGLARTLSNAGLRAGIPVHSHRTSSDRRRILVCDADSQSLHALRVVFHGAGFDVDATRTAAEALDRGALRAPAAAIIELVLPDGSRVSSRLRASGKMPTAERTPKTSARAHRPPCSET